MTNRSAYGGRCGARVLRSSRERRIRVVAVVVALRSLCRGRLGLVGGRAAQRAQPRQNRLR